MKHRVAMSIDSPAGTHCVDVFERADGTFGFEEYRRDPEDPSGWFPLHRYAHLAFGSAADALAQARAMIAWLAQ